MPRKIKAGTLETRSARLRLPIDVKPVFVKLAIGIFLGYRRNHTDGSWVVRATAGKGHYWTKLFATADDYREADGDEVMTFWQAQERARELARAEDGEPVETTPLSLDEALDDYAADLRIRDGDPGNAARVRAHLPERLLRLAVAGLRPRDLTKWRDGLTRDLAPASVNRTLAALKAALNLAAKKDERIRNRGAWENNLEQLRDAETARNVILDDDQVRAIIAAGHADSRELGLYIQTAAETGARSSQLAALDVFDFQDGPLPRLMMPSSKKGKGKKKIQRRPTPISPDLAQRLRAAIADRPRTAPLLVKPAPMVKHLPNGGRPEVIWTEERIAQVEALEQSRPDGRQLTIAEIAQQFGVTPGAISGLLHRRRQAKRPRPVVLPRRPAQARWGRWDHGRPFARVAAAAGCDPEVTIYALRHSAIVRQLLASVPVRIVAVNHDTSVAMIERTYSRYISDHADHLVRGALLDATIPAPSAEIIRLREPS
jgi:integrase